MKYALAFIASLVIATVVFIATRPVTIMPIVVLPVKPAVICNALQSYEKSTNVKTQECK